MVGPEHDDAATTATEKVDADSQDNLMAVPALAQGVGGRLT